MTQNTRSRFEGVAKSYSAQSLAQLSQFHVAVVGVGGVGSWTVETLCRSGVGKITLMDMDDICISNTNRQIHALEGQFGKMKVQALKERILAINPDCQVQVIEEFFDATTIELLFGRDLDFVIDCIDSASNKSLLISECYNRKIPMVTVGSAGGRLTPSKIAIIDLNKSFNDKLLMRVRKTLKRKFRISKGGRNNLHIPCVFSQEVVGGPEACEIDSETAPFTNNKLNCQGQLGSLMHITATMGIMAASVAIQRGAQLATSEQTSEQSEQEPAQN